MAEYTVSIPFGQIGYEIVDDNLVSINLHSNSGKSPQSDNVSDRVSQQLQAYFADAAYEFDIPLKVSGTHFQQRVWSALREIPAGQTLSYGQLAKRLNSSPRAVGNACRRNPIPIVIPCHRVISASGIGGFAGATQGEHIHIKRWLLNHEGAVI